MFCNLYPVRYSINVIQFKVLQFSDLKPGRVVTNVRFIPFSKKTVYIFLYIIIIMIINYYTFKLSVRTEALW